MPEVIIVGDDRFLKNVTDTARVLQDYGNLNPDEAEDVINRFLRDEEVTVEVDGLREANLLAANLNQVIGIRAAVKPEGETH